MSNFKVTLAELRKAGACYDGYNKLVRGLQGREFTHNDTDRTTYIRFTHKELIDIEFIAHNNGLDDALWALRCVKNEDRSMRLYAVWCARQVEYLMEDQRSKDALNVAEAFSNGLANADELAAARDAAWAAGGTASAAARAAGDASWAAARAAGDASWAAAMAAGDAAWAAARAAGDAGDAAWAASAAARAAGDAAWAAARAAGDAAWYAGAAARDAQKEMLINMCRGEAPWQKGDK